MSTSAASPPDDGSAAVPGTASSNYTLLYIIVAVLIGVILYVGIRYGRSVMTEWRQLQDGHGAAGGARLGLSMEEIAALPTFTYRVRAASASPHVGGGGGSNGKRRRSGSKGRSPAPGAVECVVCLQELEDGDVVRVLPPCRHFFHGGCIDAWLCAHSSCPVCRADLDPERERLGDASLSPPLPQLRRCGVSPERPTASSVLADILARSPLRSPLRSPSPTPMAYTRVDDQQWTTKPPSPGLSEIKVVSRSKSPSPIRFGTHLSPRTIGVLESAEVITSASSAPVVPEIVIARSMTPSPTRFNGHLSPRSVAVVESMQAIASASPSPMPIGEGGGRSLSKSPSPVHTG
ncbi:hypothetical protein EJB05_42122, partial [Eragrostis curvula]